MTEPFNIQKYMGTWYELMHYPTWFDKNMSYNTTAVYQFVNNQIQVHNSTMINGQYFDSYGTAKIISPIQLRVDFPMAEVNKLTSTNQFTLPHDYKNNDEPNYIIDYIWINHKGQYIFSVVTDLNKQSLYVLSRFKRPPLQAYHELMNYIKQHYDIDKIVQTPHY